MQSPRERGNRSPGARSIGLALLLWSLGGCASTTTREEVKRPERCERVECLLDALADGEGGAAWQVLLTPSFRVLHFDEAVARRLARAAEATWRRQMKAWYGQALAPWSPRCDIYLYPSTRTLVRMSGGEAKAGSAAATPSRLARGRMLQRRMNLAADDPHLERSTLPHEVSHIILADLLGERTVPLWANEGLAVLAEPPEAHARYEDELAERLASEQLFSVQAVLTMERYPDEEFRLLFYAQALSLTRFLLAHGGHGRLLALLRDGRPGEIESTLRRLYGVGFIELQQRWLAAQR